MIKDIDKYTAYRGDTELIGYLRQVFSSLPDDEFYDLFQDSLIEKFPTFEEKCDYTKTNEQIRKYLFTLVKNQMFDKLKTQEWNRNRLPDDIDEIGFVRSSINPEEFEFSNSTSVLTFSEFLLAIMSNRKPINPVTLKTKKKKVILPKDYELHSTVKLQVWSSNKKLSSNDITSITEKTASDTKSHHYFEWREPMSVVRIKSWVGCS